MPCKWKNLFQLNRVLHDAQRRSLGDQYLKAQVGLACNGADPKNFDPDQTPHNIGLLTWMHRRHIVYDWDVEV